MQIISFTLLIQLILLILFSWVLIHVMAVFGIFLSCAYPIWRALAPKSVFCPICRIKKVDQCQLSHSLLTVVVLLIFSTISLGVIFGELKALWVLGFPPTPRVVSFTIPSKGQYRLGEIFPMKIEINGIKNPINAVQADISFDPKSLQIVHISTDDSFADIFIQKQIDNQTGFARLTGGLPNPGFFASSGVFGTIYFKSGKPGVTKVQFLPTSMVLANDGHGTNTLKDLASASYLILPERVSEEEQKMQENTYKIKRVLGVSSENTQMTFYDENEILGSTTSEATYEKESLSLPNLILSVIGQVDSYVLDFWLKLIRFNN